MQNHFDVIIIGAGRAGLFASIQSPAYLSKLILEKNEKVGVKVLLSGGERANVSNIDIEPERDYFGLNTKALISIFKKYNQYDIMSFFSENGINLIQEDRGRLILESGDSRELVELLTKKRIKNNTLIKCNNEVSSIRKQDEIFEIKTIKETFFAKKVVITTGGKSFFQVGTTGDGYKWAKDFGHKITYLERGLSGIVTKKDLSSISGISCNLKIELLDKNNKNSIYTENGPILFTHFGLSGPIVFNVSVALGNYLNYLSDKKNIIDDNSFNYLKENILLKLVFDLENTPKRLIKFFELNDENIEILLELQDFRSWKEAKATTGGIKLDELNISLESKKVSGLYFAGEILDITGKTGGYNLQFAWSSGYVVGSSLS